MANAPVKVRRMTHDDLMKVNQIDRQLFGEQRVPTWPFSFEAYWALYHSNLSFVAEVDGRVVGFIVGSIAPEEHSRSVLNLRHTAEVESSHNQVGWIDMIGIDPGYQHMGIGQSLVKAFTDECRQNDAAVRGIARESDKKLRSFFAGTGFKSSDMIIYEKD